MTDLINPNPDIFLSPPNGTLFTRSSVEKHQEQDQYAYPYDPIDPLEVYNIIRTIKDPEHPNTLEQLRVLQLPLIEVDDKKCMLRIQFTPTVPHCSMTTLIGLCIRVKLERCLPRRFKMDVSVSPGSHDQEEAINKQLRDKERVAAAMENDNLMNVVERCLNELDDM